MEKFTEHNTTGMISVFFMPLDYAENRDSFGIIVPITVIYCIIFITGCTANICATLVIYRNKDVHDAKINHYLLSLAVSDMLLLVAGLPSETVHLWSKYIFRFGKNICLVKGLIAETSVHATVLSIVGITVERYYLIYAPIKARVAIFSFKWNVVRQMFIWLTALFFAAPLAMQSELIEYSRFNLTWSQCHFSQDPLIDLRVFFVLSMVCTFVIPTSIIIVLNVLIGLKLRSRAIRNVPRTAYGKKVMTTLALVTAAFFICWAPFHTQRILAAYLTGQDRDFLKSHRRLIAFYEVIHYLSGTLYYMPATINPILYNFMSGKFRRAFMVTILEPFMRISKVCVRKRELTHRAVLAPNRPRITETQL